MKKTKIALMVACSMITLSGLKWICRAISVPFEVSAIRKLPKLSLESVTINGPQLADTARRMESFLICKDLANAAWYFFIAALVLYAIRRLRISN
jgi:hypothetical protein